MATSFGSHNGEAVVASEDVGTSLIVRVARGGSGTKERQNLDVAKGSLKELL